jgi:hypothetical protein
MRKLVIAASIAFASLIAPASATIVDVTYTGLLNIGNDNNNQFGGVAAPGQAFTASFTVDTSLGTLFTQNGALQSQTLQGGTSQPLNLTSPITSASLTINGVTVAAPIGWFGSATTAIANQFSQQAHGVQFQDATTLTQFVFGSFINANDDSLPFTLTGPVDYTLSPNAGGAMTWQYNVNGVGTDIIGSVRAMSIHEHVAAVPEPATWAMMLLGFAGVGFMAYRRSRKDQGLALTAA